MSRDKRLTDSEKVTEAALERKMKTDDSGMTHDETQLFNRITVDHIVPREANNAFHNHRWIWQDMHHAEYNKTKHYLGRLASETKNYVAYHMGRRNGYGEDLATHQGTRRGPCIVMASGPSLDEYIQHKAADWEGGIICSTSQYSTLYHYGKAADYIVSYDYRDGPEKMPVPKPHKAHKKSNLVIMPTLKGDLMTAWKGPRLYFRTFDPYIRFYEEVLPVAYRWIRTHIAPFACSLAAEISIANYLGYGPIFLYGADLSYPKGYTYFTRWKWEKGAWKETKTYPQYKQTEGAVHKYYSETVASLAWLDATDIIDCSHGRLNEVFPTADGHEIINSQGHGVNGMLASREEIRERLGPWLVGRGAFWLEVVEEDGTTDFKLMRASRDAWEVEIRMYLEALIRKGATIDIDKNFERIRRWLDVYDKTGGRWKDDISAANAENKSG